MSILWIQRIAKLPWIDESRRAVQMPFPLIGGKGEKGDFAVFLISDVLLKHRMDTG